LFVVVLERQPGSNNNRIQIGIIEYEKRDRAWWLSIEHRKH